MSRAGWITVALIEVIIHVSCGEIFTSTARLASMFDNSKLTIAALDEYILKEESRLKDLRSVRGELSLLTNAASETTFKLVEHPVGALHVIQTLHRLQVFTNQGVSNIEELISVLKNLTVDLPSETDIQGAYTAILRLQQLYNLPTLGLIAGDVKNRQTFGLTASAAADIGDWADHTDRYRPQALEWWEAALNSHATVTPLPDAKHSQLLLKVASRYLEEGDIVNAQMYVNQTRTLYAGDPQVTVDADTVERTINATIQSGVDLSTFSVTGGNPYDYAGMYAALCRGDRDAIYSGSDVFCMVTFGLNRYDPIKLEILRNDPFIGMFYDVISDAETDEFKSQAFTLLERAKVGAANDSKVSETRVGQLTWVYDNNNPSIYKISRRVTSITGLDVTMRDELSSSEPFQVVNYGIGGHYDPHLDYYKDDAALESVPFFIQNTGERIATFLFYLNEVEEGGATVFPRVGVRVPPVKDDAALDSVPFFIQNTGERIATFLFYSAAAFWYNLKRSGERDERTLHAGCPVVLGQKWVANKWIREFGQEFRHGCGETPDSVHYNFKT